MIGQFVYPVYEPKLIEKLGITPRQIARRRARWVAAGLAKKDSGGNYLYDLRGVQQTEWQSSNKPASTNHTANAASDLGVRNFRLMQSPNTPIRVE